MDVLGVIVILALLAAGAFALFIVGIYASVGLLFVWVFIQCFWPTFVGIGVGAYVWNQGHDNLGALAGVTGVTGNFFWQKYMDKLEAAKPSSRSDSDSRDWRDGMKRVTDSEGNTTGYVER